MANMEGKPDMILYEVLEVEDLKKSPLLRYKSTFYK